MLSRKSCLSRSTAINRPQPAGKHMKPVAPSSHVCAKRGVLRARREGICKQLCSAADTERRRRGHAPATAAERRHSSSPETRKRMACLHAQDIRMSTPQRLLIGDQLDLV
ncbi:hypothetical protein RRG08_014499 [Elysia crispata]|uniref:Uncharacterized protein n=1 Tax=Elysia crispata TaxID=231223 RepID=A0AAE1AVA5_9GAST|nr:hypothetical protein RRG08_014499 [Elysia crispata]